MVNEIYSGLLNSSEDRIVFQLIKYVREHGYKEGDKLPSIRSFSEIFGISQSQTRSGVMKAAALGVVRMVPRSGIFLESFSFTHLVNTFSLLFEAMYINKQPPLIDLYDLKTTLDRGIAKRVARVRTIEELIELKQILDEMNSLKEKEEMVEADELFHNKLAAISRNQLFHSLIVIIQRMLHGSRMQYDDYVESYPQIIKDHQSLFEAIKNQDEEKSALLAEKHSNRRKVKLSQNL
ncbi:FCD domain-containing protein [Marispirochaeta aestuarii]|uniref:FadR/GntR family transcriptional regulator n=1 Tax=Marispirochaeta aestuarii TaxID=1963862 RepID=UPI0029C8AD9D|nr:FCD domain-containing protein [Marispirochaeta aestuarii]